MALKNYILTGPSVVILDDDRDPHVSWQNHLDRTKGRGGVDLVAAVGTPIYAPTDGVMDWRKNDGSAGNSCRFWHDDNKGWKDVFSHLSRYIGKDMQHFKQGELIAYSGNSGGVTQHLHRHLLDPNDVRRNPWDYFTPTSAPAGGTATPVTQEDTLSAAEVKQIKDHIDMQVGVLKTGIRRDARARLYFDSGVDGKTPESQATRAIAARVTEGFIYPLNPNPAERAGQLESLRGKTGVNYLLIDKDEAFEPLPTKQFNNLLEMANGHLRRIAAEVARQVAGGAAPVATPATLPAGTDATRAV